MVASVKKAINEKTTLSIGLILAVVALSTGAITWARSVEARIDRNEYVSDDLAKHRLDDTNFMQKQNEFIHNVDLRLTRIEAKIDKMGGK